MHGADDIIATLSNRVGDLSKRVALLQAELDGANRRVAVYEENDPTIQEALSAALRAAYQIRERAETTAQQILEQAREERRVLLKEIERLRDERDALQEDIATQRRSSISAVAPRPLSSDTIASELRSVASEALKGLFQELVDDIKVASRAAAPPPPAPPPPTPVIARAPEIARTPEPITQAAEAITRASEAITRASEAMTAQAVQPAPPAPEPMTRAPEPMPRAPEPMPSAPEPMTRAPEPMTTAPEPARPAATTTEPAVTETATWRPAVAWTEPPPVPPVVEPPLRYAAAVQPEPAAEPAPTYEAMARLKRARMTEEEDLPARMTAEAPVAPQAPVAEPTAPEQIAEVVPEPVHEIATEPAAQISSEPVAQVRPEPIAEVPPQPAAEVEAEQWIEVTPEQVAEVPPEPVAPEAPAAEPAAAVHAEPQIEDAAPAATTAPPSQPEPQMAPAARQMPPPFEVLRPSVEVEEIAPARVESVAATADILLMLSPIRSFPRLIEIERHIQALPAVRTLYVRDFRGGVATLAVALRSAMAPTDFAEVLAGLGQPRMRLVSGSRNMLELRVEGEASIA